MNMPPLADLDNVIIENVDTRACDSRLANETMLGIKQNWH